MPQNERRRLYLNDILIKFLCNDIIIRFTCFGLYDCTIFGVI